MSIGAIEFILINDENRNGWLAELTRYFIEDIQVPNIQTRIEQVTLIGVLDENIVSVATRYLQYNPEFREWFWYYRSSVAEAFRCHGLAFQMSGLVSDALAKFYKVGGPVGLFYEVENKRMNARSSVIWPSGAVFLGYDSLGRQKRCIYFKQAELGYANPEQALL